MDIAIALIVFILIYETIRYLVVNVTRAIKEEIYENALDWYEEDGK